jgi:hypothetical protein
VNRNYFPIVIDINYQIFRRDAAIILSLRRTGIAHPQHAKKHD